MTAGVWQRTRAAFAREPLRGAATLGVAAAAAAALAMLMAKLAWVLSLTGSELGRSSLVQELTPGTIPPWFARDLLAALLWGLLVGGLCGFARRRYARLASNVLLGLLCLGLAVALFLSVYVYAFWGTPPTWQLLASLDDPSNATDSVAQMLTTGRLLWLAGFVTVVAVGTYGGRRLLATRPAAARYLATALAVCTALLSIDAMTASPSRFELERNPLLAFVTSATVGQSYEEAAPPVGARTELFAPVAPHRRMPVARDYHDIRRWARERPNVVFVILETMAARHVQLTGGPVDNTPTLSRLAERGILWPRHYAHTPSSMFAIYQLLCSNHGSPQGPQISKTRPRIDCHSLSEVLVANGYRAGLFHSGRHSYSRKDKFLAGRGYEVLYDTQTMPNRESYRETSWGIEERASIDALIGWVAEDRSKPFLATYIPVYPHHPYPVPDKKYRKFKGGGAGAYRNSVFYIDQMIDRLVTELGRIDALDNTLFVFVGDHGEGFGEHPGSRMHGSKLYDEAVRTFALWYAPGAMSGALRDDRVFGHVDVVPTLLDLLSLDHPAQHVGTSALWPGERPMVPVYTGYGHPLVGFVDGSYKFIHNRRNGHSELYDLGDDPRERHNLTDSHSDWVAAWERKAREFVGFQQMWESRLPDLVEEVDEFAGEEATWLVKPASCDFSPDHFAVIDGSLAVSVGAEKTVTCRTEMPPQSGAVTGMTVRGVEAFAGSFITAMVVWTAPSGRRRQVAYCQFNGNPRKPATECEADLVRASSRFDGGGEMVMEIRYVTSAKAIPFDKFGVSEVELRYKLRN